jgi:hypothetical protein
LFNVLCIFITLRIQPNLCIFQSRHQHLLTNNLCKGVVLLGGFERVACFVFKWSS